MTEGSSKGLTWGTLLAGVVSALALIVIGCVKPMATTRDSSGLLGSGLQGSADAVRAQPGFVSRDSVQRPGDNRVSPGRH
jgi:hypothetical protein